MFAGRVPEVDRHPCRAVCALGVALFLTAGAGSAHAQPYAYVANLGSDDVTVIDTTSNVVVATIGVGGEPDGVAASADGTRVYVSNFASGDVSVIDTGRQVVIATVAVGQGPVGLALARNDTRLLVTNRRDDTVSVIDTARNRVTATVPVGPGPDAVAVTADGARAYVTNSSSTAPGVVSVIDVARAREANRISVLRNPNRVAIAPDGGTAWVTNFRAWNVSLIATVDDQIVETIRVAGKPSGVAVNPNGAFAYVVGKHGDVNVIDTATRNVIDWLTVPSRSEGIGLTRTGAVAYIANFDADTVTVLDLIDSIVVGTVPVGKQPFAIAVNCVGRACFDPPFTPRPTATRTPAPTSTSTSTPLPTATQFGANMPVVLEANRITASPGDAIMLTVTLHTNGFQVAGTQNDLHIPEDVLEPSSLRCRVNPEIAKDATAFARQPCAGCFRLRALVLSLENTAPIPDGSVLYTCAATIAASARPSSYAVSFSDLGVSDPHGRAIAVVAPPGEIAVRRTSTSRTTTANPASEVPLMCVGGTRDGLACDQECGRGLCLHGAGICDGGEDDGLLCDCYGGRCAESGTCVGGLADGLACDPASNCAGNADCVGTTKLCERGAAQGMACLRDEQCVSSACVVPINLCQSGDFQEYGCIDESDCPRGSCVLANPPQSDEPVPTRAPLTSHTSSDGCTLVHASAGDSSLLILGLVGLLVLRRRRK